MNEAFERVTAEAVATHKAIYHPDRGCRENAAGQCVDRFDAPSGLRLRAGRKVGRTLYRVLPDGREELVGMVDTAELAAAIVDAVNTQAMAAAIERSSLGTPDAVAMRERTSPEQARQVMARARQIAEEES